MNSKNILVTLFVLLVVIVVVLTWYGLTQNEDEQNGAETINSSEEIALRGTYICLPHLDTTGPQTLECAIGIESDGVNYALNTSTLEPAVVSDFNTGDMVEVTGVLFKRDQLSGDDLLLRYDIEGVLYITSITGSTTDQRVDTEETTIHTIAGGGVTFEVPSDFGLAVNDEQLLVESVIPPCSSGFDYCLYYHSDRYENTNFESAGLRIEERIDLASGDTCLTALPAGYNNLIPETTSTSTYSLSIFSPLADAAAGHYTEGALYRLAFEGRCIELEKRIGLSQFENFETAAVLEFTDADKENVDDKLHAILQGVRFTDDEDLIIFP
jgi:hypothetical protein